MLILGHRGAMALHPENTLRGIIAALDDPRIAGVEFDVRLSADGVPMVFHDKTMDRLTGATGYFERMTTGELAALSVDGEPIPTLQAVVDAWRHLRPEPAPRSFNVELKPSSNYDALVAACRPILDPLAGERATTAVVVSSFDPRVLKAAQTADAPWRLALLYDKPEGLSALPHFDAPDTLDLHPHFSLLTDEAVDSLRRPGREFRCWTVNDPAEARRIEGLGCAAVICNDPTAMANALGA